MQERACNLLGKACTKALLDQAQYHIKAGHGGACCGELARLNEAVWQSLDRVKAGGEMLQIFPMGCGALTIEQARAGEEPACAINCGDLACIRREAPQGREKLWCGMGVKIEASHDDEDIAAFQRGERCALNLYARGELGGGLCGRHKVPRKQGAACAAVGGAQRINGRGEAECVAVTQDENGCVECFW